jgi:hypothetical protein
MRTADCTPWAPTAVLAQHLLVRVHAGAAAVDRRHRQRAQLEAGLVDAGIAHHVHAQAGAQRLVFLVRDAGA